MFANMDILHVYILWLVKWIGYSQSGSSQDTSCYYGWTEHSGQCYYFSDSKLKRDQAIEDCKSRGDSNLVTVANQDVNDFIHDNRSSSEPYWIGLRPFDNNSWGWNDGRIDQTLAWQTGEPNNSSSCGVLWSDIRAFITHHCNAQYQYICESDEQQSDNWSQYNGHWYSVINDTATQPVAANHCITLGGYLARLTTTDEMEYVSTLASGHLWLGLTSLVWDDGTAYNWNNWVDDIPIPHLPCVVVDGDTDRWRQDGCHHENCFICSKAPQLEIYTYGRNETGGEPCVFPFIYEDTVYYECTIIGHNKLWCSTTYNYDDDKEWGNCLITTVTVPASSVSTSPTPISTSSSVLTTTQDHTTIAYDITYKDKLTSESHTTLVPATYMDKSAISDAISDPITTGTTSEPQDVTGSSDVESQHVKVLHIVLGIVYGLVGVMAVIDAMLAFKYWKLVHREARDDTHKQL